MDAKSQITFPAFRTCYSPYVTYYNLNSNNEYLYPAQNQISKTEASGYNLGIRINTSFLSALYSEDSKFFFGDYLGGEIGLASFKRVYNSSQYSSYALTLGFDFGFSTGYAVSDILEFGIKVFYRGFLTTNYDDLYSFISGPIFVPTINIKMQC